MKKKAYIIFILIMIIVMFPKFTVCARETIPIQNNGIDNNRIEKLYDYISNMKNEYEILKDVNPKEYVKENLKDGNNKFSFKKVMKDVFIYGFKEIMASMKLIGILIVIAIICALLNNLQAAFSNDQLSDIAYFACYALIIIILSRSFYLGVDMARCAINKMADFMVALMPVLIMLLAGVGAVSEAVIMDPFIIGTIEICAKIFSNIIIPIICMTFVLQFVNNLSNDYKVNRLTKLLNQGALWIQGIVMTIFVGVITIRGITSTTLDQVTAKTAKFAVDNFIPIVGKSLSDAISTVAGYSLILKNSISSLGLIILIGILLIPILKILIMGFVYKLAAALIEPISDSRLVNCMESAGNSLMLILSCVIAVSVMFFIMIAIMASAGRSIIAG